MKCFLLSCVFSLLCITNTGCTSTSITDSWALIEQADNRHNKPLNHKILASIEALRISQKATKQIYTFSYDLDHKELSGHDKMDLATLLVQSKHTIINIAPAKGANKLKQLNISIERAKALRQYIAGFNKEIVIIFSPELSIDTINVIVGA